MTVCIIETIYIKSNNICKTVFFTTIEHTNVSSSK